MDCGYLSIESDPLQSEAEVVPSRIRSPRPLSGRSGYRPVERIAMEPVRSATIMFWAGAEYAFIVSRNPETVVTPGSAANWMPLFAPSYTVHAIETQPGPSFER